MDVDELLKNQSEIGKTVTVEPIPEKPEFVKITPWTKHVGCLCHLSFVVPKSSIANVVPTEDKHYCCGKTLIVVEISFVADATITLDDLLNQMIEKSQHAEPSDHALGLLDDLGPFDQRGGATIATDRQFPDEYAPLYADGRNDEADRIGIDDPHNGPFENDCRNGRWILCGNRRRCVLPGYSCCGPSNNSNSKVCGPGGRCLDCRGTYHCVARGGGWSCCGSGLCGPGGRCVLQRGSWRCVSIHGNT